VRRGLGVWQKILLQALKKHGPYKPGGWRCANYCKSHTIRVLESLVARGLVVKAEETPAEGGTQTIYRLAESES
jgi:hypothetical protein